VGGRTARPINRAHQLDWRAHDLIAGRRASVYAEAGSGVPREVRCTMRISHFDFGVVEIDGVTYQHDIVIDHGEIRKRKKKASKKFRETFGHTPLSAEENIPWRCRRLIIGTGAYGRLPIMDDVRRKADARGVTLIVLPTSKAIEVLQKRPRETNAVLHVTC
jgi:hypothetical protein